MVKSFIKDNNLLKTAFVVLSILASTANATQAMDTPPYTPVKAPRKPTPRPTPEKAPNLAKSLQDEAKQFKKELASGRRKLSAPEPRANLSSVENIAPQRKHKDDAAVAYSGPNSAKKPLSAKNSWDD